MQLFFLSLGMLRQPASILAIVRKMDRDELIDKMLSFSGGTAEKQRNEGTTGDSLASPPTCSGGGHEVTSQSRQQPAAPDRVQNYHERLASVAAGGGGGVKQGGMGYLLTEKH